MSGLEHNGQLNIQYRYLNSSDTQFLNNAIFELFQKNVGDLLAYRENVQYFKLKSARTEDRMQYVY